MAGLILLTYMFAPIMIIIPFYILVKQLGIVNTRLALVLSYTTFCLPFCLWVLRAFFQSIPLDLEEAALVDGAGQGRTVWYVVLPLALPGLIAAAIFTFILAWNDFLFALVLITSEELKTLPVGVNDLFNATIVDWGMIMAAGVMITVPTVCFFAAVQRYLVQGWGAGRREGLRTGKTGGGPQRPRRWRISRSSAPMLWRWRRGPMTVDRRGGTARDEP